MTDGYPEIGYSFEAAVIVCLLAIGAMLILAAVLAGLWSWRTKAQWHTQTDQFTGLKIAGRFVEFRNWALILCSLPALALVMVTGFELTAWFAGHMYVLPIIAAVLASVLVVGIAARRGRKARTEPPVAVGMPPVAQGWSTDAQWDR